MIGQTLSRVFLELSVGAKAGQIGSEVERYWMSNMANEVETYMPLQPFALLACVIQASAQLDKLEAAEVDVEASDDVTEVA